MLRDTVQCCDKCWRRLFFQGSCVVEASTWQMWTGSTRANVWLWTILRYLKTQNSLQHTATHRNTLQHAAIHCNSTIVRCSKTHSFRDSIASRGHHQSKPKRLLLLQKNNMCVGQPLFISDPWLALVVLRKCISVCSVFCTQASLCCNVVCCSVLQCFESFCIICLCALGQYALPRDHQPTLLCNTLALYPPMHL